MKLIPCNIEKNYENQTRIDDNTELLKRVKGLEKKYVGEKIYVGMLDYLHSANERIQCHVEQIYEMN